MNEKEQKKTGQEKRVLGDEWKSWDSEKENLQETESSRFLFMGVSLISFAGILLSAFFFWYLVSPRMTMLGALFAKIFGSGLLIGTAAFTLWFFLIFLEVFFLFEIIFLKRTHVFFVKIFYFLGYRLSGFLNIDKDIFGNSFVKVSNFLIGKLRSKQAKKTLVLLPRCLQKSVKEEIQSLSDSKSVPVFIVGGGEQARRIIEKEKPDSIIAVACERDLVAGIQDIPSKLAIIGIPNKRPNGPCLNTLIDITQLKDALKLFTES